MCGRFTLTEKLQTLKERFQIREISYEYSPNYNVAPSQTISAVVHTNHGKIFIPLKWGFTIGKDIKAINVRDDKILTVYTFRKSLQFSRCLIPADGFYEWENIGSKKIPKYFRLKSKEVFSFAGIYTEQNQIKSCAIITTKPNLLVQSIHDRMPVILPVKAESAWLENETPDELMNLLQPYPADLMEAYTVGKDVNNVRNNKSGLIKPLNTLNKFFT